MTPERLQDVTLAERLAEVIAEMRTTAALGVLPVKLHAWADRIESHSEAAAALLVRGDLLIAAYDAGFDASGEGWNGEYGANTDGRYYIEKRTQALAELSATPPSEG